MTELNTEEEAQAALHECYSICLMHFKSYHTAFFSHHLWKALKFGNDISTENGLRLKAKP
jgi:hypothetical protein